MKLYCDGEAMAFEIIYHRHKDKVYSYLNKRVHDKIFVDDLFQSIFVKFHKSKELYKDDHPLAKWIYTISRSVLLDFLKKKKINTIELNDNITSNTIQDVDEVLFLDLDQEQNLSDREKEALKLRYYSDQDFDDISKKLKISSQNTRKIISRAIKKLRMKYKGVS